MTRTRTLRGRLLSGAAWLAGALCVLPGLAAAQPANPDQSALIAQGRYLAIAADCAGCHTRPGGGKPFAGGYGLPSPLGTIVSSNITPSKSSGIGSDTEGQFSRALRAGIRADGAHLYPAMPYTSYAAMTDADVGALYTYFMHGVAPVDDAPPPTQLPFPFNIRLSMAAWNLLFLDRHAFVPDATKSAEWNRGAYLTDVLEHCDTCHTPRNSLMAEIGGQGFAGSPVGPWYAPNITSDPISGVGGWSHAELVQYLKTGAVNAKGQAAGGMAEAVQDSLQFLTPADLAAIATFVKAIPPIRDPADTHPAYSLGRPANFEPALRGAAKQNSSQTITGGAALFSGYCAACHQPRGGGTPDQSYPALFHNAATGGTTADNIVAAILFGVERTVGGQQVFMPRFDGQSYVQSLSDTDVADIANYVARQFGNPALHVTAADVATARAGGPVSPLAKISDYAAPAIAVGGALILVLIALLLLRRWPRKVAAR